MKRTKHVIVLFVSICFSFYSRSQNIEFEREFESNLDSKEYFDEDGLLIGYHKCFDDKILKYHQNGVKLIDGNGVVIFSKDLEPMKNFGNNVNRFVVCSNEEHVYLLQGGNAALPKNTPVKIFRISPEGEFKENDLTGQITSDDFIAMEVLDGNIVLAYLQYDYESQKFRKKISKVNSDLTLNDDSVYLKRNQDDNLKDSFSYIWDFAKSDDKHLFFYTYYYLVDGKPSILGASFGPKGQHFMQVAKVNSKLEVDYLDPVELKEDYDYSIVFENSFAIEDTSVGIYVRPIGLEGELIEFGDPIAFNLWTSFAEIYVKQNEIESKNLIQSINDDFLSKVEFMGKDVISGNLRILDFYKSPINGKIRGVVNLASGYKVFAFSLDENLKIESLSEFRVGNFYANRYPDQNIAYHFRKSKEQIAQYPSGFRKDALDYLIDKNSNCFFTIINYDDYQLLFMDDKKTNVCKVVKIVR